MAFPTSPTDGQIYTSSNGTQYQYVLADDAWRKLSSGGSAFNPGAKNRIINGAMEIDQRYEGTTANVSNAQEYGLDRWTFADLSDGAIDSTRTSDAPSDTGLLYSLQLQPSTADASLSAGQYDFFWQAVEGYSIRDLSIGTMTLSFWVKSTVTGTYCISFRESALTRSYVAEYTIDQASTWEKKSVSVDLASGIASGGTWNYTNGAGLYVGFSLGNGTTFNTTANAWQTGNFLSTSNQVNFMSSTSNIFNITGVQLEKGGLSTDFEFRSFDQELKMCQRYYFKTYSQGTKPGTATFTNSHVMQPFSPITANGHVWWNARWGDGPMRTVPSVTTYSPGTGTSGNFSMDNNDSGTSIANIGDIEAYIYNTSTGMSVNTAYVHYIANAEI
jgi:hypothetical protein